MRRAALTWTASALVLVLLLLGLGPLAIAALIDAGHLQGALVRFLATRLGRPVQVEGPIEARLLSLTPRLVAQRVTIGNPPWLAPGTTAQIGRLTLELERWPLFGRALEIRRLELEQADLNLMRDAAGRASWQASPPHSPKATGGPPLVHALSVSATRLALDDAPRHLHFEGHVSAHDEPVAAGFVPWHLEAAGQLNGRAATVAVNGDPLSTVSHARPYRFAFAVSSSGSQLEGRGQVMQPFDFRVLEVSVGASGEDLKDLYYLTGLSLPDTGRYRLTVRIERQHSRYRYSELSVKSGESDLQGGLSIDTEAGRPHAEGELNSQRLRSVDVGAAAAGRAARVAAGPALLLPDTPLPLQGFALCDAQIDFHARSLELGRLPLQTVSAHIGLDHGVLTVAPLSATLYEGQLTGRLRVDAGAAPAPAQARLELRLSDVRVAQLGHSPIQARLELTGHGRSIHQFAADAVGRVTAVVPHGQLRAAFADITGADVARGLGLLLAKDQDETPVRCGIASFDVQQGVMHAQSLLLDTDAAAIRGDGEIRLDSESIALTLHGQSKVRHLVRLQAPVLIGGTLSHPSIGLRVGSGSGQGSAAVASGIARAPLELLGFVDSGLAHNADCAALLQQAQQ
jgi:uncharacterized protein involved in outer membrane biogenesis